MDTLDTVCSFVQLIVFSCLPSAEFKSDVSYQQKPELHLQWRSIEAWARRPTIDVQLRWVISCLKLLFDWQEENPSVVWVTLKPDAWQI